MQLVEWQVAAHYFTNKTIQLLTSKKTTRNTYKSKIKLETETQKTEQNAIYQKQP